MQLIDIGLLIGSVFFMFAAIVAYRADRQKQQATTTARRNVDTPNQIKAGTMSAPISSQPGDSPNQHSPGRNSCPER